jgi:hypothetical protein
MKVEEVYPRLEAMKQSVLEGNDTKDFYNNLMFLKEFIKFYKLHAMDSSIAKEFQNFIAKFFEEHRENMNFIFTAISKLSYAEKQVIHQLGSQCPAYMEAVLKELKMPLHKEQGIMSYDYSIAEGYKAIQDHMHDFTKSMRTSSSLSEWEKVHNECVKLVLAIKEAPQISPEEHSLIMLAIASDLFEGKDFTKCPKRIRKQIKDLIVFAYKGCDLEKKMDGSDFLKLSMQFIQMLSTSQGFKELFLETGLTTAKLPIISQTKTGEGALKYTAGSRKAADILLFLKKQLALSLSMLLPEEKKLAKFMIELMSFEKMQRAFVKRDFFVSVITSLAFLGAQAGTGFDILAHPMSSHALSEVAHVVFDPTAISMEVAHSRKELRHSPHASTISDSGQASPIPSSRSSDSMNSFLDSERSTESNSSLETQSTYAHIAFNPGLLSAFAVTHAVSAISSQV